MNLRNIYNFISQRITKIAKNLKCIESKVCKKKSVFFFGKILDKSMIWYFDPDPNYTAMSRRVSFCTRYNQPSLYNIMEQVSFESSLSNTHRLKVGVTVRGYKSAVYFFCIHFQILFRNLYIYCYNNCIKILRSGAVPSKMLLVRIIENNRI